MNEEITELEESDGIRIIEIIKPGYSYADKTYKVGDVFEVSDSKAEELISQGVAKEINNQRLKVAQNKVFQNLMEKEATRLKEEKESERKQLEEVKQYLKEERPKYQSLGCGFHNGEYYFGTKLWKEGIGYSAIITNKKELFINKRVKFANQVLGDNEIKKDFGLNYKDDFYDEGLEYIFSNKAIDKFLMNDTKETTLENIYKELVKILKEYIYFEDERKYKVVALYRIAGFFMPIWRARARLFLYAEYGSAKSRLSNILHNTGFNSVNLGDWTLPFLQRMIESTRGETHIDDFETLDEDKQKATKRLVKTGYMKGMKAGKTGDKSRRPEIFDLFNTTTLNNTEGLDFISNDRCITIRIPKIADKKYDKEPDFKDGRWKELRDNLYIIGLKYAEEVEISYNLINSTLLKGRMFSIIKPELAIANLISPSLFQEIEEWWRDESEQREYKELVDDWEFRAYEKIYRMVVENKLNDYFFLYDDVVLPLLNEMYSEFDLSKYKLKMSSMVGRILTRNPIFKSRKVNGKTQYFVNKDALIRYLKANRLHNHIAGYNSTNTTTSTTSTSSTSSTKLVEDVECVEDVVSETALPQAKKELLSFIENNSKDNYTALEDKFGADFVKKMLREGDIFEEPRGTLRALK